MTVAIPEKRRDPEEVLRQMASLSGEDTDWRGGRVFSLVYHAGDAHERLLERAHALFAPANLLNPMAFRSVKRMESEVVGMTARMLHGPASAVGSMTSGGTESILLAVYTYRERARAAGRRGPLEIVAPDTIHPAFDKACHYFGVRLRKVPVTADQEADVDAIARAIGRRTIAICASAPQYPHGVIDPIARLGEVATRRRVPFHVDACVGGFLLPWIERLGRALAPWDFRVPGVTSISADLHKYGYAGKGASVLVWRSMDLMRHQFFVSTDWAGGVLASPSVVGTRPGGPVAAAWAALQTLGEEGYVALAKDALEAADRLRAGIARVPELTVVGRSIVTVVAYRARDRAIDEFALADRLEARGWMVDRQQKPASIHLTVTANHLAIVDRYLEDVRAEAAALARDPAPVPGGSAAMYGVMARFPARRVVTASVRKVMEDMYAPGVVVPDLGQSTSGGLIGKLIARWGTQASAALARVESLRRR